MDRIRWGFLVIALLTSAFAQAQFFAGSAAAGGAQAALDNACVNLMRAQTQAIQAYSECLSASNDADKCGYPPQPVSCPAQNSQSNMQEAPHRFPQTDFKCVSDCSAKGYLYNLCISRCSY